METDRKYLIRGKIVEMRRATAPGLDGYIGIAIPDDELENLSMGEVFIMKTFIAQAATKKEPKAHIGQMTVRHTAGGPIGPWQQKNQEYARIPISMEHERMQYDEKRHDIRRGIRTEKNNILPRMKTKEMTVVGRRCNSHIYKEVNDEIIDMLIRGPVKSDIIFLHMERFCGLKESSIRYHLAHLIEEGKISNDGRGYYDLARDKTDIGKKEGKRKGKDVPLVDNRIRIGDPLEMMDNAVLSYIKRGEWTAIDALLATINKDRPKNPLGKEELEKIIFRLKDKGLLAIEMLPSDTDPSKKILCCRRN